MTGYVAALDGGGTKTIGAFADRSGHVSRIPPDAGCNAQDNPDWALVLTRVLGQFPAVEQAVLGLPGFGEIAALDSEAGRVAQLSMTLTVRGRPLTLLNDVELAYHGAFPLGGGVLVLAGTGSMAMARGDAGLMRVGGWGDFFGDEGSAFWIGQRGLQWASQMLDGRMTATPFAADLQRRLGIGPAGGAFGLSAWVLADRHPRSRIASVSSIINDLSVEGDVTAGAILDQAAEVLALHALAVMRKSALPPLSPWACAGSVFRSDRLRAAVADRLGSNPVAPQFDALGGGLWLAAQAAGWPVDADWAARIAQGLAPTIMA